MNDEHRAPESTLEPTTLTEAARQVRSLVVEASDRGAGTVSAEALQSRLFEIYDEVLTSPEALELVQQHLRRTLDRTWYGADEVAALADQIDWFLTVEPGIEVPDPGDGDPAAVDEVAGPSDAA
jgi:hypothetical protein